MKKIRMLVMASFFVASSSFAETTTEYDIDKDGDGIIHTKRFGVETRSIEVKGNKVTSYGMIRTAIRKEHRNRIPSQNGTGQAIGLFVASLAVVGLGYWFYIIRRTKCT